MRRVLVLLALILVAPAASAHVETFTQAKPLSIGPYNAVVQPKPEPMFANTALTMTAVFSTAADGRFADPDAKLVLVRPTGEPQEAALEPDGSGYQVASIAVFEPGNYTARIVVTDAEGEHANSTTFFVYPDLPIRIRTADSSAPDPLVGKPYEIQIETIDKTELTRKDALTDLTLVLERWKDDHSEMLGSQSVPLERAGAGLWGATHTFDVKGMYHLRFSSVSGGFKPDDVPILHVYALDPPPGSNPTPVPAAGALVALAVGALALARRR